MTYAVLGCVRCFVSNVPCRKTELLREIASLHDQLRSTNSSSQQTEIFAMPSAAQASQATPALSRPQSDSVCQSGLDGQISDTSSHNGHRSARSFELQRLPVEASSFQVAPTMLRLDQVDRRKINDCFALYVPFPCIPPGGCQSITTASSHIMRPSFRVCSIPTRHPSNTTSSLHFCFGLSLRQGHVDMQTILLSFNEWSLRSDRSRWDHSGPIRIQS